MRHCSSNVCSAHETFTVNVIWISTGLREMQDFVSVLPPRHPRHPVSRGERAISVFPKRVKVAVPRGMSCGK